MAGTGRSVISLLGTAIKLRRSPGDMTDEDPAPLAPGTEAVRFASLSIRGNARIILALAIASWAVGLMVLALLW